ncbi:MAG: MarR family winged helix-turn-helix transcriptional regulator [Bacillota bacterium]
MELDNRKVEVTRLFIEVGKILKLNIRKGFEDIGITLPQSMVIRTLMRFGKMKISELSSKLNLSNSTVSGIVDRLEKQQIVERTRSEEDKRIVYVSLSPKSEDMHLDFHKRAEENFKSLLDKATPQEIEKIIDGLNILKGLLNSQQ